MALTQQEQLQHLLNHIQLPKEIQGFFSNGELTQVGCFEKFKNLDFSINLR